MTAPYIVIFVITFLIKKIEIGSRGPRTAHLMIIGLVFSAIREYEARLSPPESPVSTNLCRCNGRDRDGRPRVGGAAGDGEREDLIHPQQRGQVRRHRPGRHGLPFDRGWWREKRLPGAELQGRVPCPVHLRHVRPMISPWGSAVWPSAVAACVAGNWPVARRRPARWCASRQRPRESAFFAHRAGRVHRTADHGRHIPVASGPRCRFVALEFFADAGVGLPTGRIGTRPARRESARRRLGAATGGGHRAGCTPARHGALTAVGRPRLQEPSGAVTGRVLFDSATAWMRRK